MRKVHDFFTTLLQYHLIQKVVYTIIYIWVSQTPNMAPYVKTTLVLLSMDFAEATSQDLLPFRKKNNKAQSVNIQKCQNCLATLSSGTYLTH